MVERKEFEETLTAFVDCSLKYSQVIDSKAYQRYQLRAIEYEQKLLAEFDRLNAEIERLKAENLLMVQDNAGIDL